LASPKLTHRRDLPPSFDGTHVAGETVVLELTWRGTHEGPLQTPKGSIPATGKSIEIRACAVIQVAGEKGKSQRHYFDMATLFQQIGANL
jgi:predicted ester cyclase